MVSEQHDPQLSETLQMSEKITAWLCQFFGTLECLVFWQTTTLSLIFDYISKQAANEIRVNGVGLEKYLLNLLHARC